VRSRYWLAAALTGLVVALASAPAALAASTRSSNWAGYAIHRSGVRFKRVIGRWRQPSATCVAGEPTYSSVWVGIGGYSESSDALEQIGSELDCSASGKVESSAWYELVPAGSRTIRMRVAPGDQLSASVTVSGREVSLVLSDLTRGRSFTRRVRASAIDDSSAEWIVEAPSVCSSSVSCQTLPLADFGSASFSHARAVTTTGHTGTISDRSWDLTRITLASSGRHFIDQGAGGSASALPSSLAAGGRSFSVTYRGGGGVSSAFASSQSSVRAGSLVREPLALARR